jgi:hypothetical protein
MSSADNPFGEQKIIDYRKQNLSVPEIKVRLDAEGLNLSQRTISDILSLHGFKRMKRRDSESQVDDITSPSELLNAPNSSLLKFDCEKFSTNRPGILFFFLLSKNTA